MDKIPDHMLTEILLRLPDCKNVGRCTAVCKRWLSLISHSQFMQIFLQQRHDFDPPPTLLFRRLKHFGQNCIYYSRYYRISLSSETLPSLNHYYLRFFPWKNMVIRACCDDLLLVSRRRFLFYICNIMTKKWWALPKPPGPIFTLVRCALLCRRDSRGHYSYNVAMFFKKIDHTILYIRSLMWVSVYSSDTGRWGPQAVLRAPPPLIGWINVDNVVVSFNDPIPCSDGVVYCLDGLIIEWKWVVGFGPLANVGEDGRIGCRLIAPPVDADEGHHMCYVRLGAYRGRLQLALLRSSVLKVWELNSSDRWSLVMNAVIEIETDLHIFLLSLHPTNRNVVFLLMDSKHVFQYDMLRRKADKVGEIPPIDSPVTDFTIYGLSLPSCWPTPVASFT